jgi:hypothetical protein
MNVGAIVAPGCTIHLEDRYNPDDPGVTLSCANREHAADPIISTELSNDPSESSVVVIHF